MVIEGCSFLKNLFGRNTYNEIKIFAHQYFLLASGVLVAILLLFLFVHWGFLSSVLSLITDTSIVFIAYVVCAIVYLDKEIDVVLERDWNGNYNMPKEKPQEYTKTKAIGFILIILGILSVYFSNRYRKYYAFECETFLVDENKGLYHLDRYNDDCDEIEEDSYLVPLKGYEIEKQGYSFCPSCKLLIEDAEDEYESNRYFHR